MSVGVPCGIQSHKPGRDLQMSRSTSFMSLYSDFHSDRQVKVSSVRCKTVGSCGLALIDIDLLFSTPYCLQNGELPSICTLEKRYTSKASPIESTMKGTRCKLWVWERISWFMQGLNLPWLLNGLIFGLPGWIFGLHWLRNYLWIQCRTSLDWSKTTYNRTWFHRAHSFLQHPSAARV